MNWGTRGMNWDTSEMNLDKKRDELNWVIGWKIRG